MAEAERRVEKYLHDEITKLGGTTYKFTSPGRVGVPDRIVILPNEKGRILVDLLTKETVVVGVVRFVEVKTITGKISPTQEREIKRLKGLGCFVDVVYGKDGVDKFIETVKRKCEL